MKLFYEVRVLKINMDVCIMFVKNKYYNVFCCYYGNNFL